MPFAFIEGFDDYPVNINQNGIGIGSYWIDAGDSGSVVAGRFGNQALRKRFRRTCYRGFPSTTQITVGFAIRFTGMAHHIVTGQTFMSITSTNSGGQFALGIDDLGHIRVNSSGNYAEPQGMTEARLLDNTWHFLEFELVLGNAPDGRFKLFKDGDEVLNLVGIDTKGSPTDNDLGRIFLQGNGDPFVNGDGTDFDDMFLKYNEALSIGECKAKLQSVTADSLAQWTRLGGATNASQISEISADSDTTYNFTNTIGAKDLFDMQDITETPTKIHAVQVSIAAKKDDAGTRTVRPLLKQGGVTSNGVDYFETTDYTWDRQIFELNPNGAIEWTKADINAMKVGYELTL